MVAGWLVGLLDDWFASGHPYRLRNVSLGRLVGLARARAQPRPRPQEHGPAGKDLSTKAIYSVQGELAGQRCFT